MDYTNHRPPVTHDNLPSIVGEMWERQEKTNQLLQELLEEREPDQLFDIQNLSAYLNNCPVGTIYIWVQKGKIPFMKKGKRLYFSKREIDEWLREGRE